GREPDSLGGQSSPGGQGSLGEAMREHVQAVLDSHGGNISRAAASLGIARNTLRAHIQRLGLRTVAPGSAPRPRGERREPVASSTPATPTFASRPPPSVVSAASAMGSMPPPSEGESGEPLRWERRVLAVVAVALAESAEPSRLHQSTVLHEL